MGGSASQPLLTLEAQGSTIESKFWIDSMRCGSRIEESVLRELVNQVNQAIDDATGTEQYQKCRIRAPCLNNVGQFQQTITERFFVCVLK